jgi:hypothetical protein
LRSTGRLVNGTYAELALGAGVFARITFLCILDPA